MNDVFGRIFGVVALLAGALDSMNDDVKNPANANP
jgi:hypothetical protein